MREGEGKREEERKGREGQGTGGPAPPFANFLIRPWVGSGWSGRIEKF